MTINATIKIIASTLISAPLLVACGSGEDAFTGTSGSSSNVIAASNFSMAFEEFNPEVIELPNGTLGDPPVYINSFPRGSIQVTYANVTTDITGIAGDRENAKVNSGTIYFRVEWGLLDNPSCQITSNGQCSVSWQSITNLDILDDGLGNVDLYNNVTAWTMGEESFTDTNGNGYFDDGESFIDVDEPYLDINNNDIYDAGDILIDLDNNGIHTPADGLYNGSRCLHTSLCSSTTRIPIYYLSYIYLGYDGS